MHRSPAPAGRVSRAAGAAALKRAFDLVAAAVGLALLAPIGACIAGAVALEDGAPVFYRATRVGRDGRPFVMYKFRSMRRSTAPGPALTGQVDPRLTRVGRLLRTLRLDEMPQLWNVLRGEMSIIGPRPEDPRFVALYTPHQRAVLRVRPGITGPAQVVFADEARLLRPGHEHDDYVARVLPAKLAIDLAYVADPSVQRDLQVMWATLRTFYRALTRQVPRATTH